MRKWIRGILIGLLLLVFLFSAGRLLSIRKGYRDSQKVYNDAVAQFTQPNADGASPSQTPSPVAESAPAEQTEEETEEDLICAPIEVDFSVLTEVNDDIMGWIYCEDTVINYPVVWGRDNDYYLERDYRGNSDPCGTIFSDGGNMKDLTDSNTILYGHHMQDMTMFATLKYWLEQEYYEEHPVMWFLTPEQDYRIDLFAGYVTAADSETYTIFREPSDDFNDYLQNALSQSEFHADVELEEDAQYMVLSTCAYSFYLARTVLHGKLVPVDSAGGVLLKDLPENYPGTPA